MTERKSPKRSPGGRRVASMAASPRQVLVEKRQQSKKILLHIRFIISLQPYSEPTPKIDALTA
jgi:hypothetical protein